MADFPAYGSLAAAIGIFALWAMLLAAALSGARCQRALLASLLRKASPAARTAAVAFALAAAVFASAKRSGPKNAPRRLAQNAQSQSAALRDLSIRSWNECGAARAFFGCDFEDGFLFPDGTNMLRGVEVYSNGEIWRSPRDPDAIASLGADVSIVGGISRFSCGPTGSNTYRFVWNDVFAGRVAQSQAGAERMDASIELMPNGDVAVTTNGIATVLKFANPYDWDGDGIPNGCDASPRIHDGDFYGRGNDLPAGADTNAYYYLEFATAGRLDFAKVEAVCDGPSDLGDQTVIARRGQVCRIPLLAGATYAVDSDMPFTYSAVSSEHALIATNSATSLSVSLPLRFALEETAGDGNGDFDWPPPGSAIGSGRWRRYSIHASPVPVDAIFNSAEGGCCSHQVNADALLWRCEGSCRCCGGTHEVSGTATWEGYTGGWSASAPCPCAREGEDENGAFLAAMFSKDAVIFEKPYANSRTESFPGRSTQAAFTVRAVGGTRGGELSVSWTGRDKLMLVAGSLPASGTTTVEPGQTVYSVCMFEGLRQSESEGDISARVVFTENGTGRQIKRSASITSIRVELEPVDVREGYPNRHKVGIGERIKYSYYPGDVEMSVIPMKGGVVYNDRYLGLVFACPAAAETDGLCFSALGVDYEPMLDVVEPARIVVRNVRQASASEALTNHAGWVGMRMPMYIEPEDVSFCACRVMEKPETPDDWIAPTGVLSNPTYSNTWHHTEARGAGKWEEIDAQNNNKFMVDHACWWEEIFFPWGDGGQVTWKIQARWECEDKKSNAVVEKDFGPVFYQIFTIDGTGTLRMEKLGYWVERSIDGTLRRSENTEEAYFNETFNHFMRN